MLKLIFAIVALATTFIAASAQAQLYDPKYPVCLHVFGELQGERMDCVFTSLAQCEASASEGIWRGRFPKRAPLAASVPDELAAAANVPHSTSADSLHKLEIASVKSNWRHTPRPGCG